MKTIRQLRFEQNWTQARLADEVGVSVGTINGWENRGTRPSDGAIERLCQVFDVTVDELDLPAPYVAGPRERVYGVRRASEADGTITLPPTRR